MSAEANSAAFGADRQHIYGDRQIKQERSAEGGRITPIPS